MAQATINYKLETRNYKLQAFTLIELIIVVTIVLILAAAAITQTAATRDLIRFNNTFEQVVFMVQRARTMALTRGETNYFGVSLSAPIKIISSQSLPLPSLPQAIESFNFPSGMFIEVYQGDIEVRQGDGDISGTPCTSPNYIFFERGSGRARLFCDGSETYTPAGGGPTLVHTLTINLCQESDPNASACSDSPVRQKHFRIDRAGGVPQF